MPGCRVSTRASLQLPQTLMSRAVALTRPNRIGTATIPAYIGKPSMALVSDSHGEVETYLKAFEALPTIPFLYDLGDKVDRGPNPLEMAYLLQTLRTKRTLGNHDAMWLGAGLGIKSLGIELVRWLMRYDEIDFLTGALGIDIQPLADYADQYFSEGQHRIVVKSKESPAMEAAATYLKVIAEAGMRFPEHAETTLDESELRIRKALFFGSEKAGLDASEKDIFDRLTAAEKEISDEEKALFYKLMGGLKELPEEEQSIVDHFANEFLSNREFFKFVSWMVGDGDLYFGFRPRQGYPVSIIATHAYIPIDEDGSLTEFNGLTGRNMFLHFKQSIKLGLEAWRQKLEHENTELLEMHPKTIAEIGLLAWDYRSPLFGRLMQTAARAVLPEDTGTWVEPEVPFYTIFEKSKDPQYVNHVLQNISESFGVPDPSKLVILRGHKPNKHQTAPSASGMFQTFAGGHVINIDAAMSLGISKSYGDRGGVIIFGTQGATWLSLPDLQFHPVPLPGVEY